MDGGDVHVSVEQPVRPIRLERVTLTMCSACLDGEGGECHAAGCAFWLNTAPYIPVRPNVESVEVLPDD